MARRVLHGSNDGLLTRVFCIQQRCTCMQCSTTIGVRMRWSMVRVTIAVAIRTMGNCPFAMQMPGNHRIRIAATIRTDRWVRMPVCCYTRTL